MKRIILTAFLGSIIFTVFAISCMDREPAPMCPVPTEVTLTNKMVSGFEGVDLLVVVDNSPSMEEEQKILATGFFTLINSLVNPLADDPDWPYPKVDNMRVAIVSSDLGLQYGEDGSTDGLDSLSEYYNSKTGDNGEFQTDMAQMVTIANGQIKCEEGGNQCPSVEWGCNGGLCSSPSGDPEEVVNCPNMGSGSDWAETSEESENTYLAKQVACMGILGMDGCGVEQQLEASVKGLSREGQGSFMKDNHLLAVLIVSDEEDCSIKDNGLFQTDEWKSGTVYDPNNSSKGLLNTACNFPTDNDQYLFETNRYWTELVRLKNNNATAVVFAAIVGVPTGDDSPCQGTGQELSDCLASDDMSYNIAIFESQQGPYRHFEEACSREENSEMVTEARPGRRYVEVAQSFGSNGYVYSICNENWGPAMKDIAKVIASNIGEQCYTKPLEWKLLSQKEQNEQKCEQCGEAKCDVVVQFSYLPDENKGCPKSFNIQDTSRIVEETEEDSSGKTINVRVSCPLPKLPAPLDCKLADERYANDKETIGWYYCEDNMENFDKTCSDDVDNDEDGTIDCKDEGCKDCIACGGNGVECLSNACQYGVELSQNAKNLSRGYMVSVQCLQEFSFEDGNCQENSLKSCTDGKDNDGNGVWDCDNVNSGTDPHRADKNCCIMHVDKDNNCVIEDQTFANCPKSSRDNPPDSCASKKKGLDCN